MESSEVIRIALEAGFSVSSYYGQDARKLMPMSDLKTLEDFARLIIAEYEQNRKA